MRALLLSCQIPYYKRPRLVRTPPKAHQAFIGLILPNEPLRLALSSMTRFRARVASFFQKCESTLVPIVKLKHKRRISVATDDMRIPAVVATLEPLPITPPEVDGTAATVSTLSPLLQLPVELQLDIIEAVNQQYQEDGIPKPDPLPVLRLWVPARPDSPHSNPLSTSQNM